VTNKQEQFIRQSRKVSTMTEISPIPAYVRESLERNEQVKLSGFGNFDLRDKGQRPGRNPKTGEEIPITARRVVTFRPGQKLKARVEAYAGPRSE
jgi:integration host factor subunit alpha